MKTIIISLIALCTIACQYPKKQLETMNSTETIREVVTKLFIYTDTKNWKELESLFAPKVILDYQSITGQPPETISPATITSNWKTALSGFTNTHHQIGNLIIEAQNTKAQAFCYGTVTHFIENKGVWTVVGSYNFELEKLDNVWKITTMKFNYKYQEGSEILIDQKEQISVEKGAKNKETVKTFFSALETKNLNALGNLFTRDAVHINPYHSDIFPKGAKGKKAIKDYWSPVFQNFDDMLFPIDEIYTMENQHMVYVKYTGKIHLKNNAGVYQNNYYSTFKFNEEGKIIEYVEIFNPIVASRAFGLLENIK